MIEARNGRIWAENRQEGEALLHFSIRSLELHPSVESEKAEDVAKQWQNYRARSALIGSSPFW